MLVHVYGPQKTENEKTENGKRKTDIGKRKTKIEHRKSENGKRKNNLPKYKPIQKHPHQDEEHAELKQSFHVDFFLFDQNLP